MMCSDGVEVCAGVSSTTYVSDSSGGSYRVGFFGNESGRESVAAAPNADRDRLSYETDEYDTDEEWAPNPHQRDFEAGLRSCRPGIMPWQDAQQFCCTTKDELKGERDIDDAQNATDPKPPPVETLLPHILACEFSTVCTLLKGSTGVTTNYMSELISTVAQAGFPQIVVTFADELMKVGFAPTITIFNAVLHACSECGLYQLSLLWWDRLVRSKLEATYDSYLGMIRACGKSGLPIDAEAVFKEMVNRGFAPCHSAFTAVIEAFARAGEAAQVEQWLKKMANSGLEPDLYLFNVMLCMYANLGALDTMWGLYRDMKRAQIHPDERTYSYFANAAYLRADKHNAFLAFMYMQVDGIRASLETLRTLLATCAKVGDAKDAGHYMQAILIEGIMPDPLCCEYLFEAFATAGDGPQAMTWFKIMIVGYGLQASDSIYNNVLAAVASSRDEVGVGKIFEHMLGFNIMPNAITIETLLRVMRNDVDAAKSAVYLLVRAYKRVAKQTSQDFVGNCIAALWQLLDSRGELVRGVVRRRSLQS